MNQIQKKRVKRFIEFIRKIPKRIFKIDTTCELNGETGADLQEFKKAIKASKYSSKSKAKVCGIGSLPLFNPSVFKYGIDSAGHIAPYYTLLDSYDEYYMVGDYFGLTDKNIADCFGSGSYEDMDKVTPKMVAKNLEEVLQMS